MHEPLGGAGSCRLPQHPFGEVDGDQQSGHLVEQGEEVAGPGADLEPRSAPAASRENSTTSMWSKRPVGPLGERLGGALELLLQDLALVALGHAGAATRAGTVADDDPAAEELVGIVTRVERADWPGATASTGSSKRTSIAAAPIEVTTARERLAVSPVLHQYRVALGDRRG